MKQSPGTPISHGRTAEIYLWDEGHILKLFREWCPADWVEYEAKVARAVYAAGIPSPAPGEILEVHGRRGLVYERLDGISMLQDLSARPWQLLRHARSLAEIQVQIHGRSAAGLPSYKDRLMYDIENASPLKERRRDKVLSRLASLPERHSVCHGDYHPGNILLTKSGPVVIDWMTACLGSPWADVARTSLLLSIGARAAQKQAPPLLRMIVALYHWTYLQSYVRLSPDKEDEIDRWIPVIAAARLDEDIVSERDALISIVDQA